MGSQEDRVMNSLWRRGSKLFREATVKQSFNSTKNKHGDLFYPTYTSRWTLFVHYTQSYENCLSSWGNFERKSWKYNWRTFLKKKLCSAVHCLCACVLSHAQLFAIPWTVRLPGYSVHGLSQARILEWVAISSSRGSSQPRGGAFRISCMGRLIFYH